LVINHKFHEIITEKMEKTNKLQKITKTNKLIALKSFTMRLAK